MSLGSVLKGPRFHRMESVKLIQYRSNLQYSVYLLYISFWLASLCHLCQPPLPVAIAVAVAVDVQVTQCFVYDKILTLPLDSKLREDVDEEAAAAQLLKVTETENVQATQPKENKVTGKTPTTPKLQPDCIIEVEASPEVNERGHMVIAIVNPNPDLVCSYLW